MLRAGFPLVLAIILWAAAGALGQTANGVIAEEKPVIGGLAAEAGALSEHADASIEDDGELLAIRLRLEEIAVELSAAGARLAQRLEQIQARLEQLGSAPEPGQAPEPEAVASERNELLNERAEINGLIGEADTASGRVQALIERIAELRRDLFTRILTKRYDLRLIFDPGIGELYAREFSRIADLVGTGVRAAVTAKSHATLLGTILSLMVAGAIFAVARRVVSPIMESSRETGQPSYLTRLTVAFWSTLLPVMALFVFFTLTLLLYLALGLVPEWVSPLLWSTFGGIIIVFFIWRLVHAVLAPGLPQWRLVKIHDAAARKLAWLITATAILTVLDYLASRLFAVLASPLQLIIASNVLSNLAVGLLLILIASVRPRVDETGRAGRWPALIRIPLLVIGGTIILITLLGYVGLSSFVAQQIVITGGILVTMYLGFRSADAVSAEGAFQETVLGRGLGRFFGLTDASVDRIGMLSALLVYLLILIIGIPLILLTWGFQVGDIRVWAVRFFSEINIGSVTISLSGILAGLLLFFGGFLATRWFQRWIDGSMLSRSRIDPGVRNSVRVAIGYAGIAVAALIGVSAAGLNLSNLALVAGALSLGIGFGLQNIVSNFVSGLILLAERPFKVGDWIIAGGIEGTVKRINVRATEIETFRRQIVTLPNSDLINQPVSNWTHRSKLGRVDIRVDVAYGSDARHVRDMLLELAQQHPLAIKNPAPSVAFIGFGDSGLQFEIRIFLFDILNLVTVQNDIRFAILDAFEREGIEIPLPQREIRIRNPSEDAASKLRTARELDEGEPGLRSPGADRDA